MRISPYLNRSGGSTAAGASNTSDITNDSAVPGAGLNDALEALQNTIAALNTGDITNDSPAVPGTTLNDVIQALNDAITTVQNSINNLATSDIDNDSAAPGAGLNDVLEALQNTIAALSAADIDYTPAPGAPTSATTVKQALDEQALSWGNLVGRFSVIPNVTVPVAGGVIIPHTWRGVTRYRFIPEPYDPTLDAFYENFDGSIFSGLIDSQG